MKRKIDRERCISREKLEERKRLRKTIEGKK